MLYEQLKKELDGVIEQYEEDTKQLTLDETRRIMELRELIKKSQRASSLKEDIKRQLENIPYAWFGFLPFVPDLRRRLESVLRKRDYDMTSLFNEALNQRDDENNNLKEKIKTLEEALELSSPEDAEIWRRCKEQFLEIEKDFKKLQEKHQQVLVEKNNLQQEIEILGGEKESLQEKLNKTEEDKAELGRQLDEKISNNTRLRKKAIELEARIKTLESKLEEQTNPHSYSKEAGPSGNDYKRSYHHK